MVARVRPDGRDAGDAEAAITRSEAAARLHAVAIHLLRHVRRGDPDVGLTPSRLSALSVLVYGGPVPLGELARAEQVTPPTMTRLASGLEAEGYLTREGSADDGRVVIVRATEKAVRALESARRHRIECLLELLGDLSRDDWRTVEDAVRLLEHALGNAV